MDIVIRPYSALPCATEVFNINGINADIEDFGSMTDTNHFEAEPYSCACMEFIPNDNHMEMVMNKYEISKEEFREIQEKLEEKMYVGSCGWCI